MKTLSLRLIPRTAALWYALSRSARTRGRQTWAVRREIACSGFASPFRTAINCSRATPGVLVNARCLAVQVSFALNADRKPRRAITTASASAGVILPLINLPIVYAITASSRSTMGGTWGLKAAALEDPDKDVRQIAAESLGRIGPASVDILPALAAALRDPSNTVRQSAAEALGRDRTCRRASPSLYTVLHIQSCTTSAETPQSRQSPLSRPASAWPADPLRKATPRFRPVALVLPYDRFPPWVAQFGRDIFADPRRPSGTCSKPGPSGAAALTGQPILPDCCQSWRNPRA
jgi:hypothetical protein